MAPNILKTGIRAVSFGQHCTVAEPVNLYECAFGNHCFIGPFTEVQKGVTVGNNCRIQSHSFICEGVIIGNDCFVGHGVMFINDTFADGKPAGGDTTKWKATTIGNGVSIGSNATILPVSICDNVVIGAGAVITTSIDKPGVYAGNPARLLRLL